MVERGDAPVVVDGALSTRRRLRWRGVAWIGGGLGWLWAFLALPMLVLAALSCARTGAYGGIDWTPTADNWRRLVAGEDAALYALIAARSLGIAAVTTALCLALAAPLAFAIAARGRRGRAVLLVLMMVPFATNLVVRTAGWMTLLGGRQWPARAAQGLGLIEERAALYPGLVALCLGMVATCLPFAVLPLYASVERLDWSLVEAARDCYAGRWRTLRHAVLPQCAPGLRAACVLTFIPALGMFLVSDLLGGARHMLLGNLIQQQMAARNWPFGAALCVGLIVATLIGLALLRPRAEER